MFKRWNLEWWVVCSKTHVWEHNSKGIHLPGYLPKQGSLRSEESNENEDETIRKAGGPGWFLLLSASPGDVLVRQGKVALCTV